ncbi:MAG TPA: YdcF family protein [Candidatus Saccharimonadales bacterium]
MILKIAAISAIVLGVGIALLGSYLAPDDLKSCSEKPTDQTGCQQVDAIVAVSGGNTEIRTAEAIRLYKNGWAKYLIFSGAAFDEASPSNASVMRHQALDAGVPAEAILTEDSARTTRQNAEKTNSLFNEYDISHVIIVTSPYHQRRAGLEFQIFAPNVEVINHPARDDPDWTWYWWATPRGWWLAVGELAKTGATHAGESQ